MLPGNSKNGERNERWYFSFKCDAWRRDRNRV